MHDAYMSIGLATSRRGGRTDEDADGDEQVTELEREQGVVVPDEDIELFQQDDAEGDDAEDHELLGDFRQHLLLRPVVARPFREEAAPRLPRDSEEQHVDHHPARGHRIDVAGEDLARHRARCRTTPPSLQPPCSRPWPPLSLSPAHSLRDCVCICQSTQGGTLLLVSRHAYCSRFVRKCRAFRSASSCGWASAPVRCARARRARRPAGRGAGSARSS